MEDKPSEEQLLQYFMDENSTGERENTIALIFHVCGKKAKKQKQNKRQARWFQWIR